MTTKFRSPILSHKLTRNEDTKRQAKSITKLSLYNSTTSRFNMSACICIVLNNNNAGVFLDNTSNLITLRNFFARSYCIFVLTDNIDDSIVKNINLLEYSAVIPVNNNKLYMNSYLSIVMQNKDLFDIMIVLDPLIALRTPINISSLESLTRSDWDVLFANQSYKYYDIESLINKDTNIYEQIFENDDHKKIYVKKHQRHIPRDEGFISVKSAFGGFAVYKVSILDAKTLYTDNTHVGFNLSISEKTNNMFIDTNMVLQTSEENAYLYI